MLLTYRYKLKPTKAQYREFDHVLVPVKDSHTGSG